MSNTFWGTLQNCGRRNSGEKNGWVNCYFLVSLRKKSILVASQNWSWATDVTFNSRFLFVTYTIIQSITSSEMLVNNMDCFTDIFTKFLDLGTFQLCCCLWRDRALRFHQKHLNLCSEDERRSYGFGTTCGWVINDIIFILGWTNPLKRQQPK